MKTLLFTVLLVSTTASAGMACYQQGDSVLCTGYNENQGESVSITQDSIGNTTIHNNNTMQNTYCTTIDGMTYCNQS